MSPETTSKTLHPIGLYRHRESGAYIGALDSTQAEAFSTWGYDLVEEADGSAEVTEMAKEENLPGAASQDDQSDDTSDDSQPEPKKGKK